LAEKLSVPLFSKKGGGNGEEVFAKKSKHAIPKAGCGAFPAKVSFDLETKSRPHLYLDGGEIYRGTTKSAKRRAITERNGQGGKASLETKLLRGGRGNVDKMPLL